ncbi:hypothetical protein I4U23_025505 [Adineta vaga]|nr:hypothetical protein I4U23_025505 [Adineta vaga]
MFPSKSKNKRLAARSPSPSSYTFTLTHRSGLFECYQFLSPNEYSEKTFGLLAFLVRSSVGEINFSPIMDEVEKRNQSGSLIDYVKVLEEKRTGLPINEASIEKCLMLNRLISCIKQNIAEILTLFSDIRLDMKLKLVDQLINQTINYPNDFRRRELDFNHRRNAQDMRRLFYLSHKEAKEPPSFIHLQNRVTEHLSYLIDDKMRYDSKFRDTGIKELTNIMSNSFMIVTQPHFGINPVIIYDRKAGNTEYTAKVSVTIFSLLHDFMQTHPNTIELYDIEMSLWPSSPLYKLDESQTLSWKTCQIQISSDDRPRMIQYAELSFITIIPANKNNPRMHFSDALHSLKFAIKVHMNLPEYKFSQIYQIPLESSSFAITSHHNHIPYMLSKVILDDIRRFSKISTIDMNVVLNFLIRYFKHRTGVLPYDFFKNYIENELKRAQNERKNFHTLEDVFMDFLIPFVHQVEFMARHPILSMFYADRLFLGICNSDRAADFMIRSSDPDSPIVGLRMNSIKIDYKSIASSPAANRSIKPYSCAVRVDIYNKRMKKLQYRTFDTNILPNDIVKFVTTAHTEKASYIRVLSNIDNSNNMGNYRLFTDFEEYYHDRLHEIYRTNEKYKPITNLILNVENGDDDVDDDGSSTIGDYPRSDTPNTNLADIFSDNPYSVPPSCTPSSSQEYFTNVPTNQDYTTIPPYVQSNSPINNVSSSSNQQLNQPINNEDLIRYTLSRPDLLTQLLQRITIQYPQQNPIYQNQQAYETTPLQYQQSPLNQRMTSPIIPNSQNNSNQNFIPSNLTRTQLCSVSENLPNESSTVPLQFITTQQTPSMAINEDLIDFDKLFASSD